jgi:hypothetical protein
VIIQGITPVAVPASADIRDNLPASADIRDNLPASADAPEDAPDAPTSDAPDLAFLSIGAADLAAAMFLAQRAGTAVELCADTGTLRLSAGTIAVAIPCLDGSDRCSVRIEADTFAALYEQLRLTVKRAGALTVFVSADGSIVLSSQEADFSAAARGIAIPLPMPEPSTLEAAPVAASTSSADTQTIDALFELFTLLEQHEPDWYLKEHYRVAASALAASGRLAV